MIISTSKAFSLDSFPYTIYYLSMRHVPEEFSFTLFSVRSRQLRRLEGSCQAFIENFTHALITAFSLGSYLFQCPFYFYTMTPGYSWICKTISSISSSGDLNPLFTQITESFCHHLNSIIGQSRCILKRSENI